MTHLQQAITDHNEKIQAIRYQNVGLQSELCAKDQNIAALQRCHVGFLEKEDNNNGITIIVKNSGAAEYLYIFICGHHGYRRHKTRVLLARNEGSTLFAVVDCHCYA